MQRERKRPVRIARQTQQPFGEFGKLLVSGGSFLTRFRMLLRAQFGARNQAAQVLIPRPILHQQRVARAIRAQHLGAGMRPQIQLLHRQVKARRSVHAVPINQRHCRQIELRRYLGILFGERRPLQKTECGPCMELSIHSPFLRLSLNFSREVDHYLCTCELHN